MFRSSNPQESLTSTHPVTVRDVSAAAAPGFNMQTAGRSQQQSFDSYSNTTAVMPGNTCTYYIIRQSFCHYSHITCIIQVIRAEWLRHYDILYMVKWVKRRILGSFIMFISSQKDIHPIFSAAKVLLHKGKTTLSIEFINISNKQLTLRLLMFKWLLINFFFIAKLAVSHIVICLHVFQPPFI